MKLTNAITEIGNYIEGCFEQPSIQHQHLAGIGAIHKLSAKLCNYYQKKYAVTFCNATTALHTICLAMDLKNTEVITSPMNWGGSVAPFLFQGNKLRFTSVDSSSLNINVNELPLAVTSKTKAVLSVDYNGTPVDSKAIKSFCAQHGLKYISDSAQSLGAYYNDLPAGYFADAIVLSFSPGKSCFGGEAGMVITDDQLLYEKLIWYSQHPSMQKTVFGISNYNQYAPFNGRMNPFSAILLNETFDLSLQELKYHQQQYFEILQLLQKGELIEINEQITLPQSSTFFNFSLRMRSNIDIIQVNEFLKKNDIPFFATYSKDNLIPFDPKFRLQFKGKTTCTSSLKKQHDSDFLENRIKLNTTK
jgi:perosamine synthetase